jgi:hypothetical protein
VVSSIPELPEASPENLRALLDRAGWSRAQAAEIIGVEERTVKRYLSRGAEARTIPRGLWELLLLRAGAHPTHVLAERTAPFSSAK